MIVKPQPCSKALLIMEALVAGGALASPSRENVGGVVVMGVIVCRYRVRSYYVSGRVIWNMVTIDCVVIGSCWCRGGLVT